MRNPRIVRLLQIRPAGRKLDLIRPFENQSPKSNKRGQGNCQEGKCNPFCLDRRSRFYSIVRLWFGIINQNQIYFAAVIKNLVREIKPVIIFLFLEKLVIFEK